MAPLVLLPIASLLQDILGGAPLSSHQQSIKNFNSKSCVCTYIQLGVCGGLIGSYPMFTIVLVAAIYLSKFGYASVW